jgi:hypothetical protein
VFSQTQKDYEAEEFKSTLLLKKKTGAILVYNGSKRSFTIDFIADTIKPDSKPYLIKANNNILKPSLFPSGRTLHSDSLNEEFESKSMRGVMNYLKIQHFNSKDFDKNYEFIDINGKTFLFWMVETPKANKTIDKQYYIETVCFGRVLVLNASMAYEMPSNSTIISDNTKDFLISIGKTLKLNNYPVDIKKIAKEVQEK